VTERIGQLAQSLRQLVEDLHATSPGAAYALLLLVTLVLGILTSILPCPLATNIAAISYVGRRVARPMLVFLSGLLYAAGRTLAYVAVGMVILFAFGLAARGEVFSFLREYVNLLLGPVLILVAMLLLEMVQFSLPSLGVGATMQKRVDTLGVWGALPLGMVFALAFCPPSILLFGIVLTLCGNIGAPVAGPALYGLGTAIPVVVFAVLIAFSTQSVGKVFNRVAQIEWWTRRVAGGLCLLLGLYFTLVYVFDVSIRPGDYGWEVTFRIWT
jgi:cytochrome c-type biogenesis protein